MHRLRPLLIITLVILFFPAQLLGQREVTLRLIQTSDMHGTLFPFDFINNKPIEHGLAQVSSYVEALRNTSNQHVILLDNGDFLQGQPTVYYSNFIDTTSQHIVSKVMNYLNYDAATVGNHDIEAGPRIYDELVDDFTFPWLSANIIDTRTGETYFEPYTIIEKDGIRIAILGLTTPGIPNWLPRSLWPNMEFLDMIETAKIWVEKIKEQENPHLIIGLFHSGDDAQYGGACPLEPMNENASKLVAQQVTGFDLILIGHDHDPSVQKVLSPSGDSIYIVDPGSEAHFLSDVTIALKLDRNNTIIKKDIRAKLAPMKSYIPNPFYVSLFSEFISEIQEFTDRRIGVITQSISSQDAYFGPSPFLDIIHSVQLGISKCDISFAAPLLFNTTIEKGELYVRDMYKLYSYENLLNIIELTGQEVKDYLEYSYGQWVKTMQSEEDNMLLFKTDENGEISLNGNGNGDYKASLQWRYYHFDSAAGIRYEVDLTQPVGQRVRILSMENGSPFNLEATYKVALNSYRGNGGGGHLTKGAGLDEEQIYKRLVSVSTKDMRYYLMSWIEKNDKIIPEKPDNWRFLPEEWVEKAILKDKLLLFGEDN